MAATKVDYDRILVEASYRVLLELAHLLYEYHEGIVVVGGWVPGLLFPGSHPAHIGSIDVDLALDHQTIQEIGYRSIMQLLLSNGYQKGDQPFMFFRIVSIDGREVTVEVDFLAAEYGGTTKKHRTQMVQDIRPRKARCCDLAFQDPVEVGIEGMLPGGALDHARIQIASIAPFMLMKAQALKSRLKQKDAYDIYYCLLHYAGGLDKLAEEFAVYLGRSLTTESLTFLSEAFQSPDYIGPQFVADFLEEEDPEARAYIQRDAYERMDYLLRCLQVRR